MKRIHSLLPLVVSTLFLGSLLLMSGCKDDEEKPRSQVSFSMTESDVNEGNSVVIELALSEASPETEYITFAVSSSAAVFGVDYGISNLYELSGNFTIKLAPNSKTLSLTVIALEDFENNEAIESVAIEIVEVSDGLIAGEKSHTIHIHNIPNHDISNKAMLFDGVDDYIDLGNIYDDVALPLTISAWIWLDPSAPAGVVIPIFDSQDGLPLYNGFNFLTSMTSVAGVQYGDGLGENHSIYRRAKAATFSPVAGRWVNFTAVVKSAMDMTIYFNGVDVGGEYQGESNNPMNSNSPNEVAKIGALLQNGIQYKFKGKMDELRIWNRALSTSEVQTVIFNKSSSNEPGLIGYWDFDEPSGATVLDRSPNNFNGVIKGNAIRVTSEVPVK